MSPWKDKHCRQTLDFYALYDYCPNDNRGLHTRACKYNLSALETYFECEGVKPTNLNFT